MFVYFIRHAQSANNLLYERTHGDEGRDPDPELTDYGRRQLDFVARFFAEDAGPPPATRDARIRDVGGVRLTHLYTSPMVRAMETAAAIAGATGLRPVVWPDLHEEGGVWTRDPDTGERIGLPGPDRAFFEARYPHFVLPEGFAVGGWWNRPVEEAAECFARARRVLQTLQTRHGGTDDRVALVSHGAFYNAFLSALLKRPFRDGVWFGINNVAVTRVDFRTGEEWDGVMLAYHNRLDFLPPELVT